MCLNDEMNENRKHIWNDITPSNIPHLGISQRSKSAGEPACLVMLGLSTKIS